MSQKNRRRWTLSALALLLAGLFSSTAGAQTIDELYRRAAQEKVVNFYGTLAQVNAEKILPVFEKRFPGVKINHVDITSDNLVARAVAEARGGKTLGDIFQGRSKPRCRCTIRSCCSRSLCRNTRLILRS